MFLENTASDKPVLIDQLLERRIRKVLGTEVGRPVEDDQPDGGQGRRLKYHRWVEEAFRKNMPYDEFATAFCH